MAMTYLGFQDMETYILPEHMKSNTIAGSHFHFCYYVF